MNPRSRSAVTLVVLTVLFGIRVAGQALVVFFDVGWLPPMDAWYSGLLPYPILFPVQMAILILQSVIDRGVWRDRGFFARSRPRAGRRLQGLACVYALSMVVRYAVTLSHPIPIVFHWVLAAYLFTLGGNMRKARTDTPAPAWQLRRA